MKLTSFSRGYWEISVQCKASDDLILRDYDLIKMRESGKTIGQLSIRFDLSERQVINILNKYK